jgi:hypothetical protein
MHINQVRWITSCLKYTYSSVFQLSVAKVQKVLTLPQLKKDSDERGEKITRVWCMRVLLISIYSGQFDAKPAVFSMPDSRIYWV